MKKKNITLPFNLKNKVLTGLLQSRTTVLLSNWLCQGMRYMNSFERLHRLILEAFLLLVVFWVAAHFMGDIKAIIVSFIIGHTIFWLFNGHFYVLMRYLSERHNNPKKFLSYVEGINQRVQGKEFLLAAVAFGSLSKDKFSAASDFDLRLLRKPGFIDSLSACNLCSIERARAFINAFPLDIYVFDAAELNYKIKADEPAIVMWDPEGIFENRKKVVFSEFCSQFNKDFVDRLT